MSDHLFGMPLQRRQGLGAVGKIHAHAAEARDYPEEAVVGVGNGHGTGPDRHDGRVRPSSLPRPSESSIGAISAEVVTSATVDEP